MEGLLSTYLGRFTCYLLFPHDLFTSCFLEQGTANLQAPKSTAHLFASQLYDCDNPFGPVTVKV